MGRLAVPVAPAAAGCTKAVAERRGAAVVHVGRAISYTHERRHLESGTGAYVLGLVVREFLPRMTSGTADCRIHEECFPASGRRLVDQGRCRQERHGIEPLPECGDAPGVL